MPDADLRAEVVCPGCGNRGLHLRTVAHDVPYFGETLETLLLCDACGYRYVDFLILQEREPVRYRFTLRDPEDLTVRVVRSNSCTVRLPDLGLVAEPTPRTEAFVSNVEGLLNRMADAFRWAESVADEEAHREVARTGLREIERALAGERELRIVLEDPRGNSVVASPRATREVLTEQEASQLESGVVMLEKSDLEELDLDGDGAA